MAPFLSCCYGGLFHEVESRLIGTIASLIFLPCTMSDLWYHLSVQCSDMVYESQKYCMRSGNQTGEVLDFGSNGNTSSEKVSSWVSTGILNFFCLNDNFYLANKNKGLKELCHCGTACSRLATWEIFRKAQYKYFRTLTARMSPWCCLVADTSSSGRRRNLAPNLQTSKATTQKRPSR